MARDCEFAVNKRPNERHEMKKAIKAIKAILDSLYQQSKINLRIFRYLILFFMQLSTGNIAANAQSAPAAPLCSFPSSYGCEFQIKVTGNNSWNRAYGGRLPGCNTLFFNPAVNDKVRLFNNCRADTTANLGLLTQLIKNEIASNPSQGTCGTVNYAVQTDIFNDSPGAYGSFNTTAFERLYYTNSYNSDAYLSGGSINLAACPTPRPFIKILINPSRTPFIANEPNLNGRSGQHYAVTLEVSNGPTTAPITFKMQLPAGVTITNGSQISAVGHNMVCTGSALVDCTIPAGMPIGKLFAEVYVDIASSTSNAQVSVTAAGGGDPKCTGNAPACTASSGAIAVLDAVGENLFKYSLTANTTDVSSNDKFPPNSEYTLGAGSTCANAAISKTGIATYTSPAAVVNVNAACTVQYKLCAPLPNNLVCKSATLTVSTQSAINTSSSSASLAINEEKDPVPPIFQVTKTASNNPFFSSKSGQFYIVNITVTKGNVSAPVLLLDKLPNGVSTAGVITAVGGVISNCPASGAVDLAGCTISVKPNISSIVVTVPINVAQGAASGANTATIKDGGSALCTGIAPACSGSTGPVAIVRPTDAVDDTVSQPELFASSFNVAANDFFPPGSIFTYLSAGSSCLSANVSAAGIASYTAPAFNSAAPTCVIQYQVCAPVASQAGCDSANLRVTAYAVTAVPDAISAAPNTVGNFNVAANDAYPAGAQFSLVALGSTCMNAQVSSAGLASFTSPASGAICAVKYKLCAPAPYQNACSSGNLNVTGINQGCSSLSLTYQAVVPANSLTVPFTTSGNGCSFIAPGGIKLAGSYKLAGSVVTFSSSVPQAMPMVTFTLAANGLLKGKAEYDTATGKFKLVHIP